VTVVTVSGFLSAAHAYIEIDPETVTAVTVAGQSVKAVK
jgi:hypothetical protein